MRIAQLRSVLEDALRLNAAATRLSHEGRVAAGLDGLTDHVRDLDRDWRVLTHRLKQARGLSSETKEIVRSLDQADGRLCQLFDLPPQIAYQELAGLCESLSISLEHLVEEMWDSNYEGVLAIGVFCSQGGICISELNCCAIVSWSDKAMIQSWPISKGFMPIGKNTPPTFVKSKTAI